MLDGMVHTSLADLESEEYIGPLAQEESYVKERAVCL